MTKYKNKYRIETILLPNYDYSQPGAYFITICTHNKIHHFGEIIDGKMKLNEYGKIVEQCWHDLPKHYHNLYSDQFVIMPNHIHCIMMIVETGHSPVSTNDNQNNVETGLRPVSTGRKTIHGVPEFVRALKSFSTRKINQKRNNNTPPIWQRNYYEHIIRNEKELYEIRIYIQNNPLNWETDDLYSS